MKTRTFSFSLLHIMAVLLLMSAANAFVTRPLIAPLLATNQQRLKSYSTRSFLSSSSDEVERLKESASKLRQEAQDLRKNLDDAATQRKSTSTNAPPTPPVSYTSLKDSTWTFTYRFSNEPVSENDDDDKNKKKNEPPPIKYSGRLTVTFRSDGYTDLVSHEPMGSSASTLDIEKVWGWDEEVSNEDDETYVLFSITAKTTSEAEQRFYWQARVDTNEKKEITLVDGTVTVKKDVEPPGGFWGVFNGGGILAQFQYVGNFGGKPVSMSS